MGDGLSTNIRPGRAGGERRQVVNQDDVVAGTKPGMDVVDPSRSRMVSLNILAPLVAWCLHGGESSWGAISRKLSGDLYC